MTSLCIPVTFRINRDELLVKESDRLDFEKQAEFVILVRSTDNGSPPLSIQVINIDMLVNEVLLKNWLSHTFPFR